MYKFKIGDYVCLIEPGTQFQGTVIRVSNLEYRVRDDTGQIFAFAIDNQDSFKLCDPVIIPTPVTCSNTCDGTSLYSQKCVNGHCVKDALIESNSPTCGYTPPTPSPQPAKGEVYNLDYPSNAENGETITIKASVLNKGGTSGEFSLRLIAAPQMVLVTRYVGWIAPYRFSVIESLSVTMPSSGSSANLGVQCVRHT